MVCKNCGNPVEDGVRYCTNCGTKVEVVSPTTSEETTVKRSHEVLELIFILGWNLIVLPLLCYLLFHRFFSINLEKGIFHMTMIGAGGLYVLTSLSEFLCSYLYAKAYGVRKGFVLLFCMLFHKVFISAIAWSFLFVSVVLQRIFPMAEEFLMDLTSHITIFLRFREIGLQSVNGFTFLFFQLPTIIGLLLVYFQSRQKQFVKNATSSNS